VGGGLSSAPIMANSAEQILIETLDEPDRFPPIS
jgi:hypothetical protein